MLDLLRERFADWQHEGFLPSRRIEPGTETDRLGRERGWTHWHHLFNPRQLLVLGVMAHAIRTLLDTPETRAAGLLGLMRSADYNARLSRWHTRAVGDKGEQVFSNQALNTLLNYCTRSGAGIEDACTYDFKICSAPSHSGVRTGDTRNVTAIADFWITDPPYADAVNYHDLSEFFLAWIAVDLALLQPDWATDSRRALAVVGSDDGFRRSMVDCYRNLTRHMPDDGVQVVMFTHQDAAVWADLALILWAAGLRVTAAWCVATETDSALKEGNYVQGTVLLVLRKQSATETAFLDELYPDVEAEVKAQLDAMLALDDADDPNFGDTDYQLAAYAAALRVLTRYPRLDDVDVSHELSRVRGKGEVSPIERVITQAVQVATNYLLPRGFDKFVWRTLTAEERSTSRRSNCRATAKPAPAPTRSWPASFGLRDYTLFFAETKANQTRLHTATSLRRRLLGDAGFGMSLVRHALFPAFARSQPPLRARLLPVATGSITRPRIIGATARRSSSCSATSPASRSTRCPTGRATPPLRACLPAPWRTIIDDLKWHADERRP